MQHFLYFFDFSINNNHPKILNELFKSLLLAWFIHACINAHSIWESPTIVTDLIFCDKVVEFNLENAFSIISSVMWMHGIGYTTPLGEYDITPIKNAIAWRIVGSVDKVLSDKNCG